MKYEVTVTETIEYTYEVEASTGRGARILAKEWQEDGWSRVRRAKRVAQTSRIATARKLDEGTEATG